MAISKPMIVGQPAVERKNVVDQPFIPRNMLPTETGPNIDPDTGLAILLPAVTPERAGQLSFVISIAPGGKTRACTIWVVVDIDGTLTWKKATPVPAIVSKYTGKPYDPIYD